MPNIFATLYSYAVVFFVLFVPKGLLTYYILKGVANEKLNFDTKVKSFVPYYNTYKVRQVLYGAAPAYRVLAWAALVTSILLIAIRFGVTLLLRDSSWNYLIQYLMTLWVLIFILVTYIFEIYFVVDLCKMFDKKALIISLLIPPLTCALLYPNIIPYFKKHRERLDGTFDGNSA